MALTTQNIQSWKPQGKLIGGKKKKAKAMPSMKGAKTIAKIIIKAKPIKKGK